LLFDFQGFNATLPIWMVILILIGSIALSYWTYKDYSSITKSSRSLLVGLRTASFILLLILLLNPVLERVSFSDTKPKVAILIDNSGSIAIQKGAWYGNSSMQKLFEELHVIDTTVNAISYYSFDRTNLEIESTDDLRYNASGTNLHLALLNTLQTPVFDQILVISDGISTTGRDPLSAVRNLDIPVHTIALGDTSSQDDIILQQVDYPASVYSNTTVPITATIRNEGFAGADIETQLVSDGEILKSILISTTETRSTNQVTFEVNLSNAGIKQYEIRTIPLPNEWSEENNSQRISLDVQDTRIRILHVAFELHPDVGAIRSVMSNNPSFDVMDRTWIGDNRFVEGSLPTRRDTFEVVIFHGISRTLPNEINDQLRAFIDEVPLVYLHTPGVSNEAFEQFFDNVSPIRTNLNRERLPVRLISTFEESGHPIIELPLIEWNRSPIMQSAVTGLSVVSNARNLLSASLRGTETNTPLLSIREIGNTRRAFFMASGLHLWFTNPEPQYRDWMDQLLTNIVVWTATDSDENILDVRSTQIDYDTGESILLNGQLRNESGNTESDAFVSVEVTSEKESRSFTMQSQGLGQYELRIPSLPPGNYTFRASAEKERQNLGSSRGGFSVGSSSVELLDTKRNDGLLRGIASLTGGIFAVYNDPRNIIEHLNSNVNSSNRQEVRTPLYVYRTPFWLVLLLVFLSVEWLLRKRYLLP
jgi:hypothetical protein